MQLILAKVNNQIHQDEFNEKIKNVLDIQHVTIGAINMKINSQREIHDNNIKITNQFSKSSKKNYSKKYEIIYLAYVVDFPIYENNHKVLQSFENIAQFKCQEEIYQFYIDNQNNEVDYSNIEYDFNENKKLKYTDS